MARIQERMRLWTLGPVGLIGVLGLLVAAGGTLVILGSREVARASTTWNTGDVFVGVASGSYQVYTNSGVFKETISDGMGGFTTGCAFNAALDKLYTTNFSASDVVVYNNPSPHSIAQVIPTGKSSVESIVFAANGNFFVGGPGDGIIEEYNSAGTPVDTDIVATDQTGGPDWVDLAADQMTMFYACEGRIIFRFDVASDVQLANFATLPGSGNAFALRLLPPGDGTGGLLVADRNDIKRLDGSGNVVQTYDVTGEDTWFALNLDPNGTSFWSGDFSTGNFYRFNIVSGLVEIGPINTGTGSGTLFGICLRGEPTAAIPQITLSPPADTNPVGTSHTVTATVTSGGNPAVGVLVTFSVIAGPNTGALGVCTANANCTTDANGQVSFTYVSNGTPGTDTIQACFTDQTGTHCTTATKEWVVSCGNQVVEPGEECDPPGSPCGAFGPGEICDSNCQCPSPTGAFLDHFKCYKAKAPSFPPRTVTLADQFGTSSAKVLRPTRICNPADKNGEGINDPTGHLSCYKLKPRTLQRTLVARNQFGDQSLTTIRSDTLCLPAEKDGVPLSSAAGAFLNHFQCYKVRQGTPRFTERTVTIADQFETKTATVTKPLYFCNPVDKNGEGIPQPAAHLTCYRLVQPASPARSVTVSDQFSLQLGLTAFEASCRKAALLCLPTEKNPSSPSGAFLEVDSTPR